MRGLWERIAVLGFIVPVSFGILMAQSRPVNMRLPDMISLCQVIEHPIDYDGQLIRFRAIATTDGFEFSTLSDPNCNRGVPLWSSEESDKKKDVRAFNKAMESQSKKNIHDHISAVFWGKFEYSPTAGNVTRRMLFEIMGVQDLKVSKGR
jgi:hypothetical protein